MAILKDGEVYMCRYSITVFRAFFINVCTHGGSGVYKERSLLWIYIVYVSSY